MILPFGGAHAIARYLRRSGPLRTEVRLAGPGDLREEEIFRRGLVAAQVGAPGARVIRGGRCQTFRHA